LAGGYRFYTGHSVYTEYQFKPRGLLNETHVQQIIGPFKQLSM